MPIPNQERTKRVVIEELQSSLCGCEHFFQDLQRKKEKHALYKVGELVGLARPDPKHQAIEVVGAVCIIHHREDKARQT